MDCDDVLRQLCSGPFPTGAPTDAEVTEHINECVFCGELCEALRPAPELLHEALPLHETEKLPSFSADLPPLADPPPLLTGWVVSVGRHEESEQREQTNADNESSAPNSSLALLLPPKLPKLDLPQLPKLDLPRLSLSRLSLARPHWPAHWPSWSRSNWPYPHALSSHSLNDESRLVSMLVVALVVAIAGYILLG